MDTTSATSAENFYNLSLFRQLGLLAGLAISVAIGVAIVLWAQKADYHVLYASLDSKDASEIADALVQMDIPYEVQARTGAVLVPGEFVDQAKLKLASLGLPQSNSRGFELLEKKQAFGTSQFMEMTRFRRALEGELARTIGSLNSVRTARVHLAIPKEPVFIRDRRRSSASVFLDLYSGRTLAKHQVDAIVNMVASSVPEMRSEDVTVVDQKGNLLSDDSNNAAMAATSKQLEIKHRIEKDYTRRIHQILTPVLGEERIRAEVSVDLDFTIEEQTAEMYSPESNAIRSAQLVEERRYLDENAEGTPGALVPNPPQAIEGGQEPQHPPPTRLRSTRNYELDKTIKLTRQQPWTLKRLSVAVAVDDVIVKDEQGRRTREKEPIPAEDLQQINALVRNAVGYNEARGDTVEVVNVGFAEPEAIAPLPEPSFMESPWFYQMLKYFAAGFVILFLIFGILRPVLKSLAIQSPTKNAVSMDNTMAAELGVDGLPMPMGNANVTSLAAAAKLPELSNAYGSRVETVRNMVRDDPGRVAGVVMDWVGEEDG